jgi:hypothetical protein
VRDFEAALYKYVDASNPGLLRAIMEKKTLDDALKAEMTKVIKEAKEAFLAERKATEADQQTKEDKKPATNSNQKEQQKKTEPEPVGVK